VAKWLLAFHSGLRAVEQLVGMDFAPSYPASIRFGPFDRKSLRSQAASYNFSQLKLTNTLPSSDLSSRHWLIANRLGPFLADWSYL
jgi:hypothetical protein